jgi:hypothetical protein
MKNAPAPPHSFFFESPFPPLAEPTADTHARRSFSGIAYSGELLTGGWDGRLAIDLESLTLPATCPVLLQHDRAQRVGSCKLAVADGALTCAGTLLSNPAAQQLAADADEGFPWQLSVHAEAGRTEEILPGAAVAVNGRTLAGPLTVLRQTRIRELSFTPTGVDHQTEAHVLSATLSKPSEAGPMPPDAVHDPDPMYVAELTAQIAQLTARAEAAEAALQAEVTARKKHAVLALFAELGRPCPDAVLAVYLTLNADEFAAVAADLRAARPAPSLRPRPPPALPPRPLITPAARRRVGGQTPVALRAPSVWPANAAMSPSNLPGCPPTGDISTLR